MVDWISSGCLHRPRRPPSRASGPAPPLSPCAATTAALGAGALQQEEARGALSCRAVGGTAVGPVAAPQMSLPAPHRDPPPTVASGLLAVPSSRRSTAVAGGLQRHGGSALPRRLSLLRPPVPRAAGAEALLEPAPGTIDLTSSGLSPPLLFLPVVDHDWERIREGMDIC